MGQPIGDPLLKHPKALTRIRLLVLRLLNIIKDLPTKEIGELANKFKDFKVELQLLPKGTPFKVPLKARWQPPPKKNAEIAKCAADERQEEARKQKEQVDGGIDLSQFLIQNKEPAGKVDIDIKEDKQQPFNKPSALYNEVLGGLEDEVVILEAGEDDNSWLNNAEVLQGTILDDPHQNIGKKEPIATHSSRYLSYSINLVE
ncbi:hypothetical protein V2W45_1470567 [Cenococcum geophilum]